jgi:hypothetical protein
MKKADKSAKTVRNFDQLISKFSESEILTTLGLSKVRGGEGDGGEVVITIPRPPQP